MFITREY